jgi:hypothetical protein
MSNFRRARPFLLSLALTTSVVAGFAVGAGAAKNATASSVLKAVKTAMSHESGVHIAVTSSSGTTHSTATVDIGSKGGTETYVSGSSHVKIVVTPTSAFLSGNKTGLINLVGLTAAQQKLVGSKAISMKVGTSPYASFKSNLTTSAFASFLPTTTSVSLSRDKANHYVLTWTTKATSTSPKVTSTLTISSGAKSLPLKEVATASTGGGTTVFSKWGESVATPTPPTSSTISYATVSKG